MSLLAASMPTQGQLGIDMQIILQKDVALMKVCEPENKLSITEFSVRKMRKKRPHGGEICLLGTAIALVVQGVRLMPYATTVA